MSFTNMPESDNKAVVLVDPFSTGKLLQQRLIDLGYKIILVWSDRSTKSTRAAHYKKAGCPKNDFAAVVVHEAGRMDVTVESIVIAVTKQQLDVKAVLNGSEVGVLLEDGVATHLKVALKNTLIRSSEVHHVELKVDKFQQAERVKSAGLKIANQKLAKCHDDVRDFLKEHSTPGSKFTPCVVKPQTGAGSVGVTFCDSAEAVVKAFDKIMTGEHKGHFQGNGQHCSVGVLLQEYMQGTEYIVNIVVRDGTPKTTALWKYDKRPYNGAPFVCYSKELLMIHDEPQLPAIVTYTENVLRALNFNNGAVHAEIMYDPQNGPRLVEINCRLHGGNAAWVLPAEECMNYSQLSVLMDVYLDGGRHQFDLIPSWPEHVQGGSFQVKMRSHVAGVLEEIIDEQWNRILALPSYRDHCFEVKPGGKLKKTVDMPSVPGEVTLVHRNKEILKRDYEELNNILHEGIFRVKGESAACSSIDQVTPMLIGVEGDVSLFAVAEEDGADMLSKQLYNDQPSWATPTAVKVLSR